MTPERLARIRKALRQRQPDLSVLTDHVHKGRNLSAIVRTCDAMGIGAIHCVVEDAALKSFRGTAMGSQQWVEVYQHRDIDSASKVLRAKGMQIIAAGFAEDSLDYRELDYTRPSVLLLGAEKHGLSAGAMNNADHRVTIPMAGMVMSYNVSVAAAIILNEAQRQREAAGMYRDCRLGQQDYDRLFFEWAHPAVAGYCQKQGIAYPEVGEDGEIVEPASWYAGVRENAL